MGLLGSVGLCACAYAPQQVRAEFTPSHPAISSYQAACESIATDAAATVRENCDG